MRTAHEEAETLLALELAKRELLDFIDTPTNSDSAAQISHQLAAHMVSMINAIDVLIVRVGRLEDDVASLDQDDGRWPRSK